MKIYTFENVLQVNEFFERYKRETLTKWRKIDSRGLLYVRPGSEMIRFLTEGSRRSKVGTSRHLCWAPIKGIRDDVPYIIVSKHTYSCHYGPDKCKKLRLVQKILHDTPPLKHDQVLKQKRVSRFADPSTEGCQAKVRIWYLLKFPEMKCARFGKQRALASRRFHHDLVTNPMDIVAHDLYIIEVADNEQHMEHPDIDEISISKPSTDRMMADAIDRYAAATTDMEMQLGSANFGDLMRKRGNPVSHVVMITQDGYEEAPQEQEDNGVNSCNSDPEVGTSDLQDTKSFDWDHTSDFDSPTLIPQTRSRMKMDWREGDTSEISTPSLPRRRPKMISVRGNQDAAEGETTEVHPVDWDALTDIDGTRSKRRKMVTVNGNIDFKKSPAASPMLRAKKRTRDDSNALANTSSIRAEDDETSDDSDRLFMLSLVPQLKRLPEKKSSEVKMKFMQILHEATYES